MADTDLVKSLDRLRRTVDRLQADVYRADRRAALWPVLTVAVLMLFWPTFSPRGATDFVGDAEFRADGDPVTLVGLVRQANDRDLNTLMILAGVALVLQVLFVVGLAMMTEAESARFVQGVGALFALLYLVVVYCVHQEDGSGRFGQEGYQPSASWLLMVTMAVAGISVATWIQNERT
ncbi:MAG TPA: hypothetical protein VEX15_18980 [Nocardioidaceae bacterium]|nr:hypothetical protein [Nocardioidaceae bacterium]